MSTVLKFLRNLFHGLWIFFPGILFVILTLVCFWELSQGRDLLVMATDQPGFYLLFILILLFLVLVGWYAARLVGDLKCEKDEGYLSERFRVHMPRFIGFSFFSVIILAFLQTPIFPKIKIADWESRPYYILLLLSIPYYVLVIRFLERKIKSTDLWPVLRLSIPFILVLTAVCGSNISQYGYLSLINLLLLQLCFLILVVTRRVYQQKLKDKPVSAGGMGGLMQQQAIRFKVKESDQWFTLTIGGIFIIGVIFYLVAAFSINFAIWIGSFAFVLLAFTVFMGVGFMITLLSIKKGLNFHLIMVVVAFVFGLWTERHYADLIKRRQEDQKPVFSQRADLRKYFNQWVAERRDSIMASDEYPVYFVLADGGASRSGYWVASVLSRLQDTTRHAFGRHLFCLSGASGGSVGNAAFFMLLRNMKDSSHNEESSDLYLRKSRSYLEKDFLAYTLSRMLGYDFFIQLWPLSSKGDRSAALAQSLEHASGDSISFNIPMSQLIVRAENVDASLPVLCINTTRMQDARPAVISTITIDRINFNNRLDVLPILDNNRDMKLSTAIVLGASFPYICPAGRIDRIRPFKERVDKNDSVRPNYFVDGGYVDNSGAGVVHEMLIQLYKWRSDTMNADEAFKKLRFVVIHISNGPTGESLVKRVNPFVNDLAAPLKTLVGSFTIQTSINDQRLATYIQYADTFKLTKYWNINLYRDKEPLDYSMNWVMSTRTRDSMNVRLENHDRLKQLLTQMQQLKVLK
jgi:hypothetical protein